MIVFPEACIPHQALGLLADFSKKHNVAIICGLKHITIKNVVLNLIATILPFDIGNYTNSYINLRLKEWYSPAEIKEIKKYGKEIIWDGKKYYTFPTPEELRNVSVEEYRKLGLGFRDIRVYETTKMILNKEVDLKKLFKEETETVREELLKLSGVGPKVADCILLFSYLKRFEVFPIDVWVRRVMNDLYIKEEDETKVSKVKIEKIANEKFGNLAGLAQQYLFYWRRMA